MTPVRIAVCGLIVVLVCGAFLGFAAGDVATHVWEKHPRQTGHFVGAPHVAWKTTPGAIALPPPPVVLALFGRQHPETLVVAGSTVSRLPFVPPRA